MGSKAEKGFIFCLINCIYGFFIETTCGFFIDKIGKGVMRAVKEQKGRYLRWRIWIKMFSTRYLKYEPRFNDVFQETVYLWQKRKKCHKSRWPRKWRHTLSFIYYWHKHNCVLWLFWDLINSTSSIKKNQRQIHHPFFDYIYKISKIQSSNSITCGFYCIAFIKDIIAGKTLLSYTTLFSPKNCWKKEKITYKYFKDKFGKRRYDLLQFRLKN